MKKNTTKIISIVLSAIILLAFGSSMVWAETNMLSYELNVSESSITNESDKTITISVDLASEVEATSVGYTVTCSDAIEIVGIAPGENSNCNFGDSEKNKISSQEYTVAWTQSEMENVSISNIGVITVKIPANTTADNYTVEISNIAIAKDWSMTPLAVADQVAATITVTEAPAEGGEEGGDDAGDNTGDSEDYAVTVANPSSDLVAKGGEFTVNVNVNNAYNSAKIELSYDSDVLEVVSCAAAENTDNTCSFNYATAGTILILDYGAENATDADYTVTFRAKEATTGTDVKVVSAGISTAEKAAVEDLTPVDETNLGTASIPVGYTVTLPTGDHPFTASTETVLPEDPVTITANNPYYDYELTADNATLTENPDGTWTLSGLTDNTTITVETATAKKFDVTVKIVDEDGSEIPDDENNIFTEKGATYNENFTYTWPDDTLAGVSAGVQYTLKSITVGGNTVACSTTDRITTIDGAKVTGNIVITVTRQDLDLDPDAFTVEMAGEFYAGSLDADQVENGGNAVLTLDESKMLEGYIYSVTATMGGQSVQVAQSGNVYTVVKVTGNVVFTISKSLDVTNLDVVEYLSLDGKTVWLAKISGEIAGKTYAYKISEKESANFFWSGKYGAYCYLVVEATSVDITAETVETMVAGKLSLLDDTNAVSITYNGNVNMSKNESGEEVIDVNDAQLVWNMYNAYYSDFTQVSVEKFLRADMDSEIGIGTNDAAEIINLIPKN